MKTAKSLHGARISVSPRVATRMVVEKSIAKAKRPDASWDDESLDAISIPKYEEMETTPDQESK